MCKIVQNVSMTEDEDAGSEEEDEKYQVWSIERPSMVEVEVEMRRRHVAEGGTDASWGQNWALVTFGDTCVHLRRKKR